MRFSPSFLRVCMFAAVIAAVLPLAARAFEWLPVSADDRAATESKIDPEAGGEILHRFKQIDDSEYGVAATDEYIRIKVFNEKGVQQLAKVDIQYDPDERITEIQARVIKKDGSILNVEKRAFYDRDVVKREESKVRVRSFSFPQLEAGDIAEYKWRIVSDSNILAARFYFLQNMPSRHVVFRINPAPLVPGYHTQAFFYKCAEQQIQQADDGFSYIEMKNQPAFVSEPYMEPDQDAQPWILIYPIKSSQSPQEFWSEVAKNARARGDRHAKKPSKLVVETANRIVAGAGSAEEKLDRINNYIRADILNYWVYNPRGGMDEKIRKKLDRSPDELIKSKLGNSNDIPVLFIALARAAGIDARMALCSNRIDGVFKMTLPIEYYINEIFVAVKLGDAWRFYNPAHNMVSTGKLRWRNEGVPAMIVLPKDVEWVTTRQTPAADSVTKRIANMRLNDEGTLFGDIRIEYSGQSEITARYRFHNETVQKIEEMVRESLQARQPNAEVSDVKVSNADDVLKPLVLTYSVKIPGYAESTGQRFFIQPSFFTKGQGARFTENERIHNLFFSYGETWNDEVVIKLPAGFRLEEGSAPSDIGEGGWGYYKTSIGMRKSDNSIIYKRDFSFRILASPASGYKGMKMLFDAVHDRDSHALMFRVGR